ncbi:MAG: hypothetical protein FD176_309 [Rhodospirillaceae bacterium]|nr:MAG: hypothetical protein FD176_309 [Rhodospirillaceae bacterium]TNC97442.1 MAG: hypothetical protein FD119_1042 [Stygiobacter sp.]
MTTEAQVKAITVVVPGLNEEKLVAKTVGELLGIARSELDDFQFILVDDGSTDATWPLMQQLALLDSRIELVHHDQPKGLSHAFRLGLERARFPSFTLIPSDRAFEPDGLRTLFAAAGKAELVVSYRTNQKQARSPLRYILNRLYKAIMTRLFNLRLIDIHSLNLYPTGRVRELDIQADGVAFQLECLVKLFLHNISVIEVPIALTPQRQGHARTVSLRTLMALFDVVIRLLLRR